MIQLFKKKIDNRLEADNYRDKLILVLEQYWLLLPVDDGVFIVNEKRELIQMYIDFHHKFHRVSKMDKKVVAEIGKKFPIHLKRMNKPPYYIEHHNKIIGNFFTYIAENYQAKVG